MKPTGVQIDQSIVPTIATIGMTLKSANLIKAWKLREFNRIKDKEVMENNNKPVHVHAMPIVGVVPVIFGGDKEFKECKFEEIAVKENNHHGTHTQLSSRVPINFSEKDKSIMSNPYNDAIVDTAFIANYQMGSNLIDMRSSINIIFKSVFNKLKLANSKLDPIKEPLYDF